MKNIEISEELFNNVFEGCVFNYVKDNVIHYSQPCVIMEGSWVESETSINDFFFDCKEWAFNNGGYVLQSQSYAIKNYKFTKGAFCYTHFSMGGIGNSHWADTEVEAIIKACEWILSEVNK